MKKFKFNLTNEYIYTEELKNGLKVFLIPNNKVKNFYITYTTKFGSIHTEFKGSNDNKYIKIPSGVAHFLEHLTFKMKDGDASDYFSSIGSSSNAFTSFDLTCYEVWGHDLFKENLSYLIKFINTPYYTKENVEAERGIILEEIKTGKDNPAQQIYFESNKSLFNYDKHRDLIAGDLNDVKKITLNDILNAYNYFYNPKNMFIVISGNFNPNEALAIIEEEINKYKRDSLNVIVKKKKEPIKVCQNYKEITGNVETDKVSFGIKFSKSIFDSFNLDRAYLNIYTSIILNSNFGYSSEFKEELLSSNIINKPLSIEKFFTDDCFIISLSSDTNYSSRLISLIKENFSNLELSLDDFNRKKKVAISNYILSFDDIEEVNANIVADIIENNDVLLNLLDRYNNLDYDTCLKILNKLNNPKNISIVVMHKKNAN